MTDYSQLPEWTCHKVVRAAKITCITDGHVDLAEGMVRIHMLRADHRPLRCDVDKSIFARGHAVVGDYFVAYNVGTADEYIAWSPAAVFEDGYSLNGSDLPLAALLAGKKALFACSEDPTIEAARECFKAMMAALRKERG